MLRIFNITSIRYLAVISVVCIAMSVGTIADRTDAQEARPLQASPEPDRFPIVGRQQMAPIPGPPTSAASGLPAPVARMIGFLNREMDRFHRVFVVVAPRPENSEFYPAAMPENGKKVYSFIEPITAPGLGGGLKVTFPRSKDLESGWAGVAFLNAQIVTDKSDDSGNEILGNWGQQRGTALGGATRIDFSASSADGRDLQVRFYAGGINKDQRYPNEDSLEETPPLWSKDRGHRPTLTSRRDNYFISLKGKKLDHVIGAFAVADEQPDETEHSIYLHSVIVNHKRMREPRLVNRRWIGTPYRHPKGTPLSGEFDR